MYETEVPSGENMGPPRKPGVLEISSGSLLRLSRRRMYTGPQKGVSTRRVPSGEMSKCELNAGKTLWYFSGKSIVKREIRRSPAAAFAENLSHAPAASATNDSARTIA